MTNILDKPNYTAWKTKILSWDDFEQLETEKQLIYLCNLGNLSANSHNTQPVRYKIEPDNSSITLYISQKTVLPASDVAGRQAIISLGCSLENIILAAQYYGYQYGKELLTQNKDEVKPSLEDQDKLIPVIKIILSKTEPNLKLEPLVKCITKRKIVRSEYDPGQKIPNDILDKLAHPIYGDEIKLHLITDNIRRLAISEFQAQADGYVINSRKFSRELGEWLLPNDTDQFIGMPGIGFGLQDDQAIRMHKGLLGQQPLEPEDGLRFAQAGKIGLEKSPLVGFITAKKDDIEHWILTGQVLENSLLLLNSQNIQTAIHAGIVEVPMIKQMFSISLGTLRPITALFRAGYIKNKQDLERPASPRWPIESLLVT